MKRSAYFFLFLIFQLSCNMLETEIKKAESFNAAGIEIQLLNATDGYDYLMKSRFIEKMGKMDFSIRMKRDFTDSTAQKGKEAYAEFLKPEVLNWNKSERDRLFKYLRPVLEDIRERTPNILQKKLCLVKTSGKEEFEAFYTSEEAIVFPKKTLTAARIDRIPENFTRILYHELFHIYTRFNYEKHPALYGIIGFKPQDYDIPKSLDDRRITNPDFFDYDYLIELETEKGDTVYATILTYNKSESFDEHQRFSDIIGFGLFPVEKIDERWKIQQYQGKFQPIPFKEFKNFRSQVGNFTDYLMGAEEILADGYSMKMIDEKFNNLKNSNAADLKIMNQLIEVINSSD